MMKKVIAKVWGDEMKINKALLILMAIMFGWASVLQGAIPSSERTALIALYNSTNGDGWIDNTGWKTPPLHTDGFALPGTEGTWKGVGVDVIGGSDHVKWINLNNNNLQGPLPVSIGNFSKMTLLRLNGNRISGTLPVELFSLVNLGDLRLYTNDFVGSIPIEIGNLVNVRDLILADNELSGSIPSTIGNCTNLESLGLWANSLSGNIPPQLGQLSKLVALELNRNNLTGSIPLEICNLSNLVTLSLYENSLTGIIPSQLGNLSNLTVLSLHTNQLTGEIPTTIGNLANLEGLALQGNQLTGAIPPEIGNLSNLLQLHLHTNQLTGIIPEQLANLKKLTYLNLSVNPITGNLPSFLGTLSNLSQIRIANTQIVGTIPSEIGNLSNLRYLFLHANKLSGSIPASFGNLSNLQELLLSNNQLSGSIPNQIGNIVSLQRLLINSNALSGPIPSTLINLINLGPDATDIGYNALYSVNGGLIDFLTSKDPDWATTQTIAPTNLAATPVNSTTVNLTWDSIPYTGDTGGYRIFVGTTSGGPYTFFQQTTDKTVTSTPVTGLNPGTPYYFVIQTRTNVHDLNQNVVDSEYSAEASATTIPVYTVTFTAGSGGTLSGTTTQVVEHGSSCTAVTAEPNIGYHFVNWIGSYTGTDNPLTVSNVTSDMTINANFAINQYTVTFIEGTGGTITGNRDQAVNHGGSTTAVTAVPNACFNFVNWTGSLTSTDNPLTVSNVISDMTISANFISGQIPQSERDALISFYNSTNGDGWINNTGWKTPPLGADGFAMPGTEATWFGVGTGACNDHVYSLIPHDNNLVGTIPNDLGNLTKLRYLDLNENQLTGPIPISIGNLIDLYYLSVHGNQLSGSIPLELGNLTKLTHLLLYSNQFSGSIPAALGNLTILEHLWLQANQLTGAIPAELGNLGSLLTLYLHTNQLTGIIPEALGNLSNLNDLHLSANPLTGTIPASLANLTNLTHLFISGTDLTGPIPAEIGTLTNLVFIYLHSNKLSGGIPAELGNLTSLQRLLINGNTLTGNMPASLTSLTQLNSDYTNIGYNGLKATNADLIAFLNDKTPNWSDTQTIAPGNVAATAVNSTTVNLTWDAIPYTGDTGGYRIFVGTTPGGPYTFFQQTTDKTITSIPVTGLNPNTPYYFVVQTRTDVHGLNKNVVDSEYSAEATATTIPVYTVTFTAGSGGSLTGTTTQVVEHGSSCTAVTAVPNVGYKFFSWFGDYAGTANPLTVTNVTEDMNIIADFDVNQYTVTFVEGAGGTITGAKVQTVNHGGSTTAVMAEPGIGYHFVNWTGSYSGTDNPLTVINVTSNMTITANFALNQYTVTFVEGAGGTITGIKVQTVNHGGSTSEVTAVPNTGYSFVNWTGDYTGTNNPLTILNITSDMTITANFAINQYTVTFVEGANGTITGIKVQTVNHGGSTSEVTAVPNAGFSFVDWTGDYNGTNNPLTIANVTSNMTVTANFTLSSSIISGTILHNSSPLSGVVMSGLPGNPVTNASGFYTSSVDYDWSGTVTPTLAGYAFTPASRSYSNVTSDQANQDYTAALAPSLQLTSPNGWEHWTLGSTKTITWNAVNYTGTVRLVLFKAGSRFGNIVANIPATAGSYSWTVGLTYDNGMAPEGADYRLYLRSTDGTLIDPSDYRLGLIDPAQLEVTAPNGGESWELGTTQNITWNANGYVGTVRLILFQKAAKVGQIVASLPADQGSYAWTVGTSQAGVAPAGINYSIRLLAGDGSQEDYSDGPLTLIENDALIVDHHYTALNVIPSEWLDQASQEKLLVLSAGNQDGITLGLRLLGDRDARLTPAESSNSLGLVLTEGSWLPQGASFELQEWRWTLEKSILESQATVVIVKPDEQALLAGRLNAENYLATLAELSDRLPGLKLVCATVAMDEPNEVLARFNRQVRESVLQNKGTLFDAADIESWRNNQQQLANEVPVRHPAYRAAMGVPSTDNLANQGSATWWLLARLSGWEGKEAEE